MKLPAITKKQHEILKLIYKYRFLQRSQIQEFLGHRDKRRVSAWLKDLREKQYLAWVYNDTHYIEKTKPASYYLGPSGIRYLKTITIWEADRNGRLRDTYVNFYLPEELHKRYRDQERQPDFIARCLLLADCALELQRTARKHKDTVAYDTYTRANYVDAAHDYYFLNEKLKPQLCVVKWAPNLDESGIRIEGNFLMEVFDASLPQYQIKKRLKDYLTFLEEEEWDTEQYGPSPGVYFIFAKVADLIYAKRRIRRVSQDLYNTELLRLQCTTVESLRGYGIAGAKWEQVRVANDD